MEVGVALCVGEASWRWVSVEARSLALAVLESSHGAPLYAVVLRVSVSSG